MAALPINAIHRILGFLIKNKVTIPKNRRRHAGPRLLTQKKIYLNEFHIKTYLIFIKITNNRDNDRNTKE